MLVTRGDVFTTIYPIVERIERILTISEGKIVVLVAGASHAGKTTTSIEILEYLLNHGTPATLVRHDWWNLGRNRTPKGTTVSILEDIYTDGFENAISIAEDTDADRFENAIIHELLPNGVFWPPVYDFKNRVHRLAEGNPLFFEKGVLIVEGAFVFKIKGLREISDLKIYIDVPWSIRERRLRQCYLGFKGLSLEETEHDLKTIHVEKARIVEATAKYADVILRPDSDSLLVDVPCNHK